MGVNILYFQCNKSRLSQLKGGVEANNCDDPGKPGWHHHTYIVELDLSLLLRAGAVIFLILPASWYSADTLLAADSFWRQRVKVSRDIPSLTLFLLLVKVTITNSSTAVS